MRGYVVGVVLVIASSPTAQADPDVSLGADAELLPVVTNHFGGGLPGTPATESGGPTAYAVGGLVDWQASSHVSLALAPRYAIGIDANHSQLDLRVRLAAGTQIARDLRVFAFAAPDYSTLFPSSTTAMSTTLGSVGVELGAGASYRVSPRLAITAELGYQVTNNFGRVAFVGPGDPITFHDDYASFAIGFVTPVL